MLRYSLVCTSGHGFESWFRDSASCDAQMAKKLVACPICGDTGVQKAIMTPAVARRDRAGAEPARPMALMADTDQAARELMGALRRHVIENSEDVGNDFARLARDMHEGEAERRSIRGVATTDEVRALHEDGIEAHPLPLLPDEHN